AATAVVTFDQRLQCRQPSLQGPAPFLISFQCLTATRLNRPLGCTPCSAIERPWPARKLIAGPAPPTRRGAGVRVLCSTRRNDVANGFVGVCSDGISGGATTRRAKHAGPCRRAARKAGGGGQSQYGNVSGTRNAAGRRRQDGGANHRVPAEKGPVQEGRGAD